MAAVTICSDFGAPQNKVWHCFHCFPIDFPWSDGTWASAFLSSPRVKPGCNSMWTKNFQMFKMDLEKADEPDIKLSTFTES